jgi:hypothetical protein
MGFSKYAIAIPAATAYFTKHIKKTPNSHKNSGSIQDVAKINVPEYIYFSL